MGEDTEFEAPTCVRCEERLAFLGEKDFHEGSRGWGFFLGDFGELFTGGQKIQMYACPSCRHIEFFLPE
jgi:hypothetical protein